MKQNASHEMLFFEIDGISLDFRVSDFSLFEGLATPFVCSLELALLTEVGDFADLVGREARVTLVNPDPLSGGTDRHVHGVIQSFAFSHLHGDFYCYSATLVPTLWQLSLRTNSRIFQEQQLQKIIETVLEEGGIHSDRYRFVLDDSKRFRKFCVQYRESNLAFIDRLLREEGLFYFFEHDRDKHVMLIGDGSWVHRPLPGKPEIVCNSHGGLVAEQECITEFTFHHEQRPNAYRHKNFNPKHPSLDLNVGSGTSNSRFEVYDYPALHVEQARGEDLARIRLEQLNALQNLGQGKSSSCRLLPGFLFTLSNHVTPGLNGEYLLVQVWHAAGQPQVFEETAAGGAFYQNSFWAIPSKTPFRPDMVVRKPVVQGIQTAMVVGPRDQEIFTDEYGRVRVRFHWDRRTPGQAEERSSCWIRVAQPWGGSGRGAQFIPRVGDEVLVDFIDGDPDRPIVVGSVYNARNMPINNLEQSLTQSGFRTKTHQGPGFHELRFDDAKGAEEIYLRSQKDWNITVLDSKNQSIGGSTTTTVGGTSMESAKEIILTAESRITLVCGESTVVIQSGSVDINSPTINLNEG